MIKLTYFFTYGNFWSCEVVCNCLFKKYASVVLVWPPSQNCLRSENAINATKTANENGDLLMLLAYAAGSKSMLIN